MAQSVWTGGSHHTGLAALPHENIQGEFMTILKAVSKTSMERSMELEAKTSYSACTEDCPKCRVSDG